MANIPYIPNISITILLRFDYVPWISLFSLSNDAAGMNLNRNSSVDGIPKWSSMQLDLVEFQQKHTNDIHIFRAPTNERTKCLPRLLVLFLLWLLYSAISCDVLCINSWSSLNMCVCTYQRQKLFAIYCNRYYNLGRNTITARMS